MAVLTSSPTKTAKPGDPERKKPSGKPAKAAPAASPGAGQAAGSAADAGPVKVTDSLRRSVEHAYEYYAAEPDIVRREILDRICLEFGLDRQTVHEITSPVHGEQTRQKTTQVTPQQRREICDRYDSMVRNGERPEAGRRRQIAREMGLPLSAVVLAVGQWRMNHHDPRQLSREEKFRIEKTYWGVIHGASPASEDRSVSGGRSLKLSDVVEQVTKEVGLPAAGVNFWIDQLHDDPRSLDHVPTLPEEKRAEVEAAYRSYLEEAAPPRESLHRLLADRFGCTVRQAHRTLLLYRWQARLDRLECSDDERQMVEKGTAVGE